MPFHWLDESNNSAGDWYSLLVGDFLSACCFFAEAFWSLKHFGDLSHSCIETRQKNVFSLYFQTF